MLLPVALLVLAPAKTLTIVSLGSASKKEAIGLKARLEKYFGIQATLAEIKTMPSEAYVPDRHRYRADKLMDFIQKSRKTDYSMALTDYDISTTKGAVKDWGIFGLGACPGTTAVVSSFRLHKHGPITTQERLVRVAMHEFGHMLGLPHCPNFCLMHDAEGSISGLDTESDFCPSCKAKIKAALQ